MLKKLVIAGSLAAVAPLLAGCPAGVVFGVTQFAGPLVVAGVEALNNDSSTSAVNSAASQTHAAQARKSQTARSDTRYEQPKNLDDFSTTGLIVLCNQITTATDNYQRARINELVTRGGYRQCPEDLHYGVQTQAASLGVSATPSTVRSGNRVKIEQNVKLETTAPSASKTRIAKASKANQCSSDETEDMTNGRCIKINRNSKKIKNKNSKSKISNEKIYQKSEECSAIFTILTSGQEFDRELGSYFTKLSMMFSDVSNYYCVKLNGKSRNRGEAGRIRSREMERIGDDYEGIFSKRRTKQLIAQCIGWSASTLNILKNKVGQNPGYKFKISDVPAPANDSDYPKVDKKISQYIEISFKSWDDMDRITPQKVKDSLLKKIIKNDNKSKLDRMFFQ